MGPRSVPAPFLTKTYQLVDDAGTDDVVSWGEKGSTFVVWKTAEFAQDLLPNYFKHSNFPSFVRQLNTYGFRKIAPDKWEFANDNFRRGEKGLLAAIRRRKTKVPATPTVKPAGGNQLLENSGEEAGTSSMSSPESKNPGTQSVERADLMGGNEKLRKDNEKLRSELAQTRKQCEELMTLLTGYLKVGPDQINQIVRQGIGLRLGECGALKDGVVGDDSEEEEKGGDDGSSRNKKEEEGLKVFGVWLNQGKKRGRCCDTENDLGLCGHRHGAKVMKTR